MSARLVAFAFFFLVAPVAVSARPVVVELFTSEGCSSCPPADAYLSELSRERREVLPLAFHVTYWDSLGWRDPYSLEAATQRQAEYSARFGESAYTPEMVIDGQKGLVGSNRRAAEAAIALARKADEAGVEVSGVRHGGTLSVMVGRGSGHGRVLLVGYDNAHVTEVGRGENTGRTLRESNIVRSIQAVGEWTGAPLKLDSTPPAGEQAAILIQSTDGAIIGAARVANGAP
ncbi:DUF1223 domain-containing protein [Paraburkholderia silvatlantica]|uniref:Secreted protein n=1 Tax=Paraburkholderia silvatlantica TaxID=321895 RepID=A0ABR6FHN3_9BURK|nr:DUF1223 domain-containing protein [Paraburkholderia silvatlantica]MBB2926084.1 hypothetical protein [Paraburkholderia silvatlantica]PVY23453.1 hypothetical protein C7411_12989 [Paraburkholderia silvatlantica]PXW30492.1 hypothetical protein C7413_12889 [Paraburkholderia silvatlantica]